MASLENVDAFRSSIIEWSYGNLRDYPWRRTSDPYRVLIAEILLQRTQADQVVPIYDQFIREYPSIEELARADVPEVAELIGPLGLQNKRASALVSNAAELEGKPFPSSQDELLKLSYVGRYAANAVLCFSFGERRPILDSNVTRLYERYFDISLDYRDPESWRIAEQALPNSMVRRYNLAILDHPALICTPSSPKCSKCPLRENCAYFSELSAEQ